MFTINITGSKPENRFAPLSTIAATNEMQLQPNFDFDQSRSKKNWLQSAVIAAGLVAFASVFHIGSAGISYADTSAADLDNDVPSIETDVDDGASDETDSPVASTSDPAISVYAISSPTVEGMPARFRIVSNPVHDEDLSINVNVQQTGDYMESAVGDQVVNLPAGDDAEFEVNTVDDNLFEFDGTISVRILAGTGYVVDEAVESFSSVGVHDNDSPPLVSVSAPEKYLDEGDTVIFNVSSSYEVSIDTSVSVYVNASSDGLIDYMEGIKTVTIPAGLDTVALEVETVAGVQVDTYGYVSATIVDGLVYNVDYSPRNTAMVEISIEPREVEVVPEKEDVALVVEPGTEDPGTDDTGTDDPGTEDPGTDDTGTDDPGTEDPGTEDPGTEDPGTDDPETEDPGTDESENDEEETPESVTPVLSVDPAYNNPVVEGQMAIFRITSDVPVEQDLSVNIAVTQVGDFIEADEDSDYAQTLVVPISLGYRENIFSIETIDDTIEETDGHVIAVILAGVGYDFSGTGANITILDDDQTLVEEVVGDSGPTGTSGPTGAIDPVVSIASKWGDRHEGGVVGFTLTADTPPDEELSINVGIEGGENFLHSSVEEIMVANIPASETEGTLYLVTVDDGVDEDDQEVTATILPGPDYQVASAPNDSVTTKIMDNDVPVSEEESEPKSTRVVPEITIEAYHKSGSEGTVYRFNILASEAPKSNLTVYFNVSESVIGGFDVVGNGYIVARTGLKNLIKGTTGQKTAVIKAGTREARIRIATGDDKYFEEDGQITVKIQGGFDYTIGSPRVATATVLENDPPPVISISAVKDSITEGETAQFKFSTTQSLDWHRDVKIEVLDLGNFLSKKSPSVVYFPPWVEEVAFDLPTLDDKVEEEDGTITVKIVPSFHNSRPVFTMPDKKVGSASVTVKDNDGASDKSKDRESINRLQSEVLGALLEDTTDRTVETVDRRFELAFSDASRSVLSPNSQSTITNMLTQGGNSLNENGGFLSSMVGISSFELPISSGLGNANSLTVWGSGDKNNLSSSSHGDSFEFSGDSMSGHVGLDTLIDDSYLAGMSASQFETSLDFTGSGESEGFNGEYLYQMTTLSPYFGWISTDRDTELHAILGFGQGQVEIIRDDFKPESADSSLLSSSFHASQVLYSSINELQNSSNEVRIQGQALLASQHIEDNQLNIGKFQADERQLRVAAFAEHSLELDSGTVVSPSAWLGAKWDADNEDSASTLLGSKITLDSPLGLAVSSLVNGELAGDRDLNNWGIHSQLSYDYGQDNLGFQFDASSTWGQIDAFNNSRLASLSSTQNSSTSLNSSDARIEANVGYGFGIWNQFLQFNPSAGIAQSEGGYTDYQLGLGIVDRDNYKLNLVGKRLEKSTGRTDGEIELTGQIQW